MTVDDRCPGVLRPHQAADGLVIRLRLPGGQTTGPTLAAVSRLAQRYGNGELQLTTRSGLQLRGLTEVPESLRSDLTALGFLPSRAHDRVRNVVASPLTGIAGGVADLRSMIFDLDRRLCGEPELADLPGRFLFALDDGAGDVGALPFDLGYRAGSPMAGEILVGSPRHRMPVSAWQAAQTLIRLARAFLVARRAVPGRVWHVGDLPDWIDAQAGPAVEAAPAHSPEPPLGIVGGAASVHVPLGLLTPAQVSAVLQVTGPGPVVITPWRGLVVPDAAAGLPRLLNAGLVEDRASGWALVSACVGAPHCARTTLDTRAVATEVVSTGVRERVHVSGCERRCGAPATPHRELVAR